MTDAELESIAEGGISHRDVPGSRATQFRHVIFLGLFGSHRWADGRLCARHRRSLLHAADDRHADGRVRRARKTHFGYYGRNPIRE